MNLSRTQSILLITSVAGLFAVLIGHALFEIPKWWMAPFILVGILSSFGMVRLQEQSERNRALKHMASRLPYADTEFGEKYFLGEKAAIATRLRPILARLLNLDLSRVSPDDSLVEDLRMDELDSVGTVEFLMEVEHEFDVEIPTSIAERMRTFRDVVDYVFEAKSVRQP